MVDPLPVERFADLTAEVEATGDKDRVLTRENVDRETWEATRAHWLKIMADEAERSRPKVSIRYRNVYTARRKVHDARLRREDLSSRLVDVVAPDTAHLDVASAVLAAPLRSTPETVSAPTPPRVAPPSPIVPRVVPPMVDAPSIPVVRTAPMPATPPPPPPIAPLGRDGRPPSPPAGIAPPPRRMWSTMVTDGAPLHEPATPFKDASPAPPRAPTPPAAGSTPAGRTASPAAPLPPRDPKLAGTVTFDLEEVLPRPPVRVGTGTGPLPNPASRPDPSSKGTDGLPFGSSAQRGADAPRSPVPPAPPPPPSSGDGERHVPRGRTPIPAHLQATSAVDLSQIVKAVAPFALAPAARGPVPAAPGSSGGLPFASGVRAPEAPSPDPPGRPRIPSALASTTFADPQAPLAPATPFTASGTTSTQQKVGPPRLSINVFASITAEIAEAPADVEAILRKYSMTKDDHVEETSRWEAEFERNADARARYSGIVARYRGYIAQRKPKP